MSIKIWKKTVSLLTVLALSLSLLTTAWAAEPSTNATVATDDLQGHWAESQMRKWVDQDLMKGYDGSFNPDRPITRAEFITLINRSFNLSDRMEVKFTDLAASHWAYEQIAIAVKAGYVKGYDDHTIRLNQAINREESAVMVQKLLNLESSPSDKAANFNDASSVSKWSSDAVLALANQSIIVGNVKGNFVPQGKLTRAEAVTLLDKAIEYAKPKDTVYSVANSVYGPKTGTETIKGNVIVSAPGITLQNLIIEGNLTVTEAVGEGDAFFKKVTVKGTTTIQGGGSNSVHFEDSLLVRISIDKRTGTVRVLVAGDSSIQHVVIHSPVKLEESNVTNSGFANVEIAQDLPAGSQVTLIGQFEDVFVKSSDIKISVPSGSVNQLNVAAGTTNTEIDVNKNATIMDLILNAVAKLLGQGTITNATVNDAAKGSTFQTRPTTVDGSAANTITAPGTGGGGGGGNTGSNNGGNTGGNNGGNTGGENGGNNGGGETVPCTGTVDECRAAALSGLTVSGFNLKQLDASQYTTGQTGYSPDVFAYSIVTERDMAQAVKSTISVTQSTYSKVSYDIWGPGNVWVKSGEITTEQGSFELDIHAKQDSWVRIAVKSGDGIATKVYQVYFEYPRTLQEGLKVGSYMYSYLNKNKKSYQLQPGSIQGEKIRRTDSVLLYEVGESAPFLTCSENNGGCTLPDNKVPQGTGVWKVEVLRDGEIIHSGDYHYDFSPATVLTSDIGLEAKPYTKLELIEAFVNNSQHFTAFEQGYKVFLDTEKLAQSLPGAKYIVEGSMEMYEETYVMLQGLSKEELKAGIQSNGYSGYSMSSPRPIYYNETNPQYVSGALYYQSENDTDLNVYDKFIIVGFYDENFNLLGQSITVLQFDQDHVADGYTAVRNWKPITE